MEDEYILASFLHPKFKRPLSATPAQKKQNVIVLVLYGYLKVLQQQQHHPRPRKKQKRFLERLMNDEETHARSTRPRKDNIDLYIKFNVDKDKNYLNPLVFWKSKLACCTFSIPRSSAAMERTFSAAGQVVNQRRSNLDRTSFNHILFLCPIENNFKKTLIDNIYRVFFRAYVCSFFNFF